MNEEHIYLLCGGADLPPCREVVGGFHQLGRNLDNGDIVNARDDALNVGGTLLNAPVPLNLGCVLDKRTYGRRDIEQPAVGRDLDGTNGSYTFTVTLSKGAGTPQTTETLTLSIIATAYDIDLNNTPIFTDGDENVLTSLSSETLVTTMSHRNDTAETENLTMYVVIYTASGKMVYFGQEKKEINAGDSADFRVQIDMPENVEGRFALEGYYANVFVWDSETFIPVMQKHVFPE